MAQAQSLHPTAPRSFGRARVPPGRGRRLLSGAIEPRPAVVPNLPALVPASGWREDLRFFMSAYLLGLLFFLILIV